MARKTKEELALRRQATYVTLRAQAFTILGGARCNRCGFPDIRALQIDHRNGGGGVERRKRHYSGVSLFRRIIRFGRGGFQVLCANCNIIKKGEEMASKMIEAPWTDDQVASLNGWQTCGWVHPFTAPRGPGERGEPITLIATKAGWVAVEGGPVVQTWAHDFMANWSFKSHPLSAHFKTG